MSNREWHDEQAAGERALRAAESETQRVEPFLRRLEHGGTIVSTADLTPEEVALARAADRLLVLADGLGFVYLPGPVADPAMLRMMRAFLVAGLAAIGRDGHLFGSRPCSTCEAVSSLAGQDFGCVAFAKRQKRG